MVRAVPASSLRNTATTKPTIIDAQLAQGRAEVNVSPLSHDEVLDLLDKLAVNAPRIRTLRLLCMPRGVGWLQYQYDAQQDRRARQRFIFHTRSHHDAVDQASGHMQHKRVHLKLSKVLGQLLASNIEELQLGMRLATSCYKMLAAALPRNTSLRKLSFAGSHMGDAALEMLRDGLVGNTSIEELDLTACDLTDGGAACIAAVVKLHAGRRVGHAFHQQLRAYPDASRDMATARVQHQRALRAMASEVDALCGGLLHLEVAENLITDQGVRHLCAALSFDRRLVLLSLRANALTTVAERELVELMRDHRALMRVDLRQNPDPVLGILKLQKPRVPAPFNPALGFAKQQLGSQPASPSKTEYSAALWELLDTASLAGQSLAGSFIGPVPVSPTAAVGADALPGDSGGPPNLQHTASSASWGEEPQGSQEALRLFSPTGWGLQPPLPKSRFSAAVAGQGSKLVAQSWSSDAPVHSEGFSAGKANPPAVGDNMPSPGSAILHHGDPTQRYGNAQPTEQHASPSMLVGLPPSPLATGIFGNSMDRRRKKAGKKAPRRQIARTHAQHQAIRTRVQTYRPLPLLRQPHQPPRPLPRKVYSALRGGLTYSTGPKQQLVPKRKRKKSKAAKQAAVAAAARAVQVKAAADSRALAEAAAAATAELVQRDMEYVSELALMFRDLEIAVSSLELMCELNRDEPRQYRQYQQYQRSHERLGGGGSFSNGGTSSGGGAWRAVQGVHLLGVSPVQGTVPGTSPAALAQQLRRWQDLCDHVLLKE